MFEGYLLACRSGEIDGQKWPGRGALEELR